MKSTNINDRRIKWLAEAKKLAIAAADRQSALQDTCTRFHRDENRKEALQHVAGAARRIHQSCKRLCAIETGDDPPLGAAALSISEAEPLQIAFTLLVMARLSEDLSCDTSNVAGLVEIAAGRDPGDALTIRSAFRSDTGILRPLVECAVGRTLDELDDMALKESVFNQALALSEDPESITVSAARSMRLRRRVMG
jgi:hypothetical protein